MMRNRILAAAALLCFLTVLLPRPVCAQETAQELSGKDLVTGKEGFASCDWLFDGTRNLRTIQPNAVLELEAEQGIGSLYLMFDVEYGPYTLVNEDSGKTFRCGENRFLHEYIDLTEIFGQAPKKASLHFGEDAPKLQELRAFTLGDPPADVQRWRTAPAEGVDLMLFSAHSDDEQLFFAGVLPYYGGELGYDVQVAYLTRHANYGTTRPHEALDGLWACGVTIYPVFGDFLDYYTESLSTAYQSYANRGIDQEQLLSYVVEQLRRAKPLVALGHDVNGEYGHGMHRMYSELLQKAVEVSGDPTAFPESAEAYGTWDVPKTYLHLYPEGKIHMNWDQPLEHFDGMTAYEVSKELGYPAHVSQYDGFSWYMHGHDTAEDIPHIGPCDYGLYRTTVGPDQEGTDLFEHLTTRAEQKRQEEEARILEEERRIQEEEARRKAAQEAQQAESTQPAVDDAEVEKSENSVKTSGIIGISGVLFALSIALIFLLHHVLKRN